MDCATVPIINLNQKVFELNRDAKLSVLSFADAEKLNIHIKLVDGISGAQLCLSEDLLVEVVREGRKFLNVNVEYPCANIVKRIHVREECGAFLIKYHKKKIVLMWDAMFELESKLPELLKHLHSIKLEQYMRVNNF